MYMHIKQQSIKTVPATTNDMLTACCVSVSPYTGETPKIPSEIAVIVSHTIKIFRLPNLSSDQICKGIDTKRTTLVMPSVKYCVHKFGT